MSIAIDALPTTDEVSVGEIGHELLGLLMAITEVDNRDGGGGGAKEKIRAAVQGEGYAGEWVRKLLLHYQVLVPTRMRCPSHCAETSASTPTLMSL